MTPRGKLRAATYFAAQLLLTVAAVSIIKAGHNWPAVAIIFAQMCLVFNWEFSE